MVGQEEFSYNNNILKFNIFGGWSQCEVHSGSCKPISDNQVPGH